MGCINKSALINVNSIKYFQSETQTNIKQNESKNLSNIIFNFSIEDTDGSLCADNQSQILNNGRVENNKLIFI